MESEVYFADLRARSAEENKIRKIQRLFDSAGFPGIVRRGDLTAIKMHFGEAGNDSFVNPIFVRPLVERIKAAGAKPFLTDTRTLYAGSRSNAVDHLTTAIEHGFAYAVVGAPVIVADGLTGGHARAVPIGKKHFPEVLIAGDILDADSMIVLSHFKAHMQSGFGGAIKNLGMGCAPPAGKREMHCARAQVAEERCGGCGACGDVCPQAAVSLPGGTSVVDRALCIGCGECMTVCPTGAIEFDWEVDLLPFMERMAEYAFGAVANKRGRVGYVNFLTSITPDCDCVPWSDAPIVPDIGVLASRDPVAIDAASTDLVNAQPGFRNSLLHRHHEPGGDKFRGVWECTQGRHQLRYAEEIGLGTSRYRLVPI
ncbi:MAG: DUF362 domain-containing protein [Methanomicrobiales archaeon]|nr:DUF362 domain-containing protein [Methanomicrobiales archaeon]MDI6876716.1 DUF362 domain-containing protein [Methanomicrobiales archaeon]